MSDEESTSFTFIDKRQETSNTEADEVDVMQAEPATPKDPEQKKPEEASEGQNQTITVEDVILSNIELLFQVAWRDMGLVADPATGLVLERKDDAKLAIDAMSELVRLIEPRMDDETRREVRRIIATAQATYLEKVTKPLVSDVKR